MDNPGQITQLLAKAQDGAPEALDEVMRLVYDSLHRIAVARLARERRRRPGAAVSLQPTELVSEAFLKLVKQRERYDSRGHFFAIATRVMLRVLMEQQRHKRRLKRGGEHVRVTLHDVPGDGDLSVELLAFEEALDRLEKLSPRTAEVTKLRLLWGLTVPEMAETLELSVSTVEREWRFARRWLTSELVGED